MLESWGPENTIIATMPDQSPDFLLAPARHPMMTGKPAKKICARVICHSFKHPSNLRLHSGNGKWGPRIESMYFLLKSGIFQPAMLNYRRLEFLFQTVFCSIMLGGFTRTSAVNHHIEVVLSDKSCTFWIVCILFDSLPVYHVVPIFLTKPMFQASFYRRSFQVKRPLGTIWSVEFLPQPCCWNANMQCQQRQRPLGSSEETFQTDRDVIFTQKTNGLQHLLLCFGAKFKYSLWCWLCYFHGRHGK